MFSLSPSERKVLIILAFVVFLGTLIRFFNLEVKDVAVPPKSAQERPLIININQASPSNLEKIHGIGPAISLRIVEYRKKYGHFKNIQDLKKVKGIGPKKAEVMKKYIKF